MKTTTEFPHAEQNQAGGPEHLRGRRILLPVLLFILALALGGLPLAVSGDSGHEETVCSLQGMDGPDMPGALQSRRRRPAVRTPRGSSVRQSFRSDRWFSGGIDLNSPGKILLPFCSSVRMRPVRVFLLKCIGRGLPYPVRAGPVLL